MSPPGGGCPLRIAVTGGIACGKSLFSSLLERLGAAVLDADEVAHGLERPGGAAVPALAARFGNGVLGPDGGISRPALARRVFSDPGALAALDAILHPLIKERVEQWIRTPGPGLKAAAIPLLFEAGWDKEWDVIVCVASSETAQLDRLTRLRGHTEEEARRRIAAQMPIKEKAARSHVVVWNEAGKAELAREAERVYGLLTEKWDEYGKRRDCQGDARGGGGDGARGDGRGCG